MIQGALIGVGNVATNAHVPAFRNDEWLRQSVEITAAADLSEENLKKLRQELPSVKTYGSAEKLFSSENVDFVDISAPPNAHVEMVRGASERGFHILCEKPRYSQLFREFAQDIESRNHSRQRLDEAVNRLRRAEICYRSARTGITYHFFQEVD